MVRMSIFKPMGSSKHFKQLLRTTNPHISNPLSQVVHGLLNAAQVNEHLGDRTPFLKVVGRYQDAVKGTSLLDDARTESAIRLERTVIFLG